MIRDAARALVIVLALLILLAEVDRADEVVEYEAAPAVVDDHNDI